MRVVAMLGLAVLAGCASGAPPVQQSSVTISDLEDAKYALDVRIEDTIARYQAMRAACPAGDPCEADVAAVQSYGAELVMRRRDVRRQIERAEADAYAAEEAAESRRATGRALTAVGGYFLRQAQPPIVCNTSDTSNPTTVCQ